VVEDCSTVFTLQNSTITGTLGAYPFYCMVTGALDCGAKKLEGWIQCAYCIGALADSGVSCAGVVGGSFAGPLTADYAANFSFIDGTWNGAEVLAGNDGGSPGPDGAPPSSYLSDSGYGLGDFGGDGTWNATWK
jgi:hypothetical protein